VVTFEDVAPTLLALANLPVPGSTYRDRAVVEMSGRSLLPVLEGKAQSVREASHVFADEHGIEGYVRQGDWKAVRLSTGVPGTPEMDTYLAAVIRGDLVVASRLQAQFPRTWHLYNIVQDRGETVNLAASELGRLKRLQALYEVYRKRVGVVDP
jgi:arylsulfatase